MSEYKKMRDYTHEEFVNLISNLSEEELIKLSANYGGYPILFRMSLDERICHIPFIQPGSAVIIRNKDNEILLQERTDKETYGIPGGCQELGERLIETAIRETYEETGLLFKEENLKLIDVVSGPTRRNSYNNGDIVYNNTALYLATITEDIDLNTLKYGSETTSLRFVKPEEIEKILSKNLMDNDLINTYLNYIAKTS